MGGWILNLAPWFDHEKISNFKYGSMEWENIKYLETLIVIFGYFHWIFMIQWEKAKNLWGVENNSNSFSMNVSLVAMVFTNTTRRDDN